jgi:pyruvate/oxaloacetate carboxyltransferase
MQYATAGWLLMAIPQGGGLVSTTSTTISSLSMTMAIRRPSPVVWPCFRQELEERTNLPLLEEIAAYFREVRKKVRIEFERAYRNLIRASWSHQVPVAC